MIKMYKYICCLIKCSKCLYFAKKIICVITVMLILGAAFTSIGDKKACKKMADKIKAVM